MTNLFLSILLTNQLVAVSFDAQPWTHYRLERTLTLPATNWLAADYLEAQPYHFPCVLFDVGRWGSAAYRVVGLN